jgi:hypothetical protein
MAELPDWQPLDRIDTASEGTPNGRVVAVVASRTAVSQGWAESAAVGLAKSWSDAGQKVVLIDAAVERPGLHEAAGLPNAEGLSDATLFGASVGRVAQKVDDGGYFLITAGTAVADASAVVRSPRWDRLAKGFVEAGVTLALFLRDGEDGTAAFLGSASEIVVLAPRGEPPPDAVRELEPLVRLVTGQTEDGRAVEPAEQAPWTADALKRTASEGRSKLLIVVAAAVVLVVLLLAVFGIIAIPGLTRDGSAWRPNTAGPLIASVAG